jgi:hypothetical protein
MIPPVVAALLLAACSRDIQNSEAVRQGVLDYLNARQQQTGLDMNLIQVDVTTISFQRNEARATISFRPKNSEAANAMTKSYTLDRKGNKWVVRPRSEGEGDPHGGGSAMPADHPPVGGQAQPGGTLPPGHPPTGAKP